jgi:hypothetical protein
MYTPPPPPLTVGHHGVTPPDQALVGKTPNSRRTGLPSVDHTVLTTARLWFDPSRRHILTSDLFGIDFDHLRVTLAVLSTSLK